MAMHELNRNDLLQTSQGFVKAPGFESRLVDQDQRVAQGVSSGSLSSEELAEVRSDRAGFRGSLTEAKGNDGRVDLQERRELHQEMNEMSQAIFSFKHNQDAGAPRGPCSPAAWPSTHRAGFRRRRPARPFG